MLFVSTGKDPGFTHLSSLARVGFSRMLGEFSHQQLDVSGIKWDEVGRNSRALWTGGTPIEAIVILLLWQAVSGPVLSVLTGSLMFQPKSLRLWISIFIRLFQWQEAPSHIMQNPHMHVKKKKPPVILFSLPVPAKKMKLLSLVRLILPYKSCCHHEKELPAIIEAHKLLFCLSTFFIISTGRE